MEDMPEKSVGEVVATDDPQTLQESQNQATTITALDDLIGSQSLRLEQLREESKKIRTMIDDHLMGDETYRKHVDQVKEATKIKNATKQQLLKQPQAASLVSKTKDTVAEIKELETSLSEYLKEYSRLSGVNEIQGPDGEVREIVTIFKLIKRAAKAKR